MKGRVTMRLSVRILGHIGVCLLAAVAQAQSTPPASLPTTARPASEATATAPPPAPAPAAPAGEPACRGAFSEACGEPAATQKTAYKLYQQGVKLHSAGKDDAALDRFTRALALVPRNADYAAAQDLEQQQVSLLDVHAGNTQMSLGHDVEAMAAFRAALAADPASEVAAAQLRNAAHETLPVPQARQVLRPASAAEPIQLVPNPGVRTFHLRTDTRSLITQVAQVYGITAIVDPAVAARPVRFDMEDVDFWTALSTARLMTRTFVAPLTISSLMAVPDTPQMRQQYERMSLQTFYISSASTPVDLNEMVNMLRSVFEVRFLTIETTANAVVLRAPANVLREASDLIGELQEGRSQVVIELQVYQISRTLMRDLGMALPLQFTMFNLSSLTGALNAGGLQSILSQLQNSGTAVNAQSIAALLGQSSLGAILANPLATFGGGKTLFGVGIPPATLKLTFSDSRIRQLDHLSLRASNGAETTFRFGTRFPVLTATASAVYTLPSTVQIPGLTAAASSQNLAAFPQFNYQDLGLTVKATPVVHGDSVITLKLDTQIQALGASSVNGVPVLDNRQYQGTVNLKDGETAVVASSVSEQDVHNITGIPGLARVPVLGLVGSEHNTQLTEDELLLTITPHIVRMAPHRDSVIVVSP